MREPCDHCDTMGPFTRDEQAVRDLHRAWHDLARIGTQAFRELRTAFTRAAEAVRTATTADYALIPNDITAADLTAGERWCNARHLAGGALEVRCTRPEGHDGDHIAHGTDDDGNTIISRQWDRDTGGVL